MAISGAHQHHVKGVQAGEDRLGGDKLIEGQQGGEDAAAGRVLAMLLMRFRMLGVGVIR